ncbi:MAG: UDP-N-acetylmuramate--L-alanine ligase [Methylotenera sp.]|nr:UDP-N-acetylmuramate--L-alanine ligase [Oligoflexia bacterium]
MHNKQQTQLHFVGIGGIGMSGIAEVLLNQGYQISGSDLAESEATRRLKSLGARIHLGHTAENIMGAHVVVISSAVKATNPEVMKARESRIPVIPRAEMLGELMRGKVGIAVAGTHGKTTTTSLLASVLMAAGLDPTIVIGGKVGALGSNAKLGQGQLVVAEADESDGSFLHLPATFGIVTNIDSDHLDHFGTLEAIEETFSEFIGQLPFYGLAAVCGDDEGVRRCLSRFHKPFLTYGFSDYNDYFAKAVTSVPGNEMHSRFEVHSRNEGLLGSIEIQVPGRHNILNALAAIVIARRLEIPFSKIAQGLRDFSGVKRRFDIRWKNESLQQIIVDDYGHHPTEVLATLAAARSFWKGRIITIFQPHRYSRTQNSYAEFLKCFKDTDLLYLADIYAAGEEPIAGVSSEILARDIMISAGKSVLYVGPLQGARDAVVKDFRKGDLVLCLGAGTITKLPDLLVEAIEVAAAVAASHVS